VRVGGAHLPRRRRGGFCGAPTVLFRRRRRQHRDSRRPGA